MVFTSLGANEKQAFFDLLDEYFTSRPELLSGLGASSSGAEPSSTSGAGFNSRAASSAVHSALAANPEATAHLISSGLRHGAQNSSVKNSPFANAASDPGVANSFGRVAAASLAFGQRNAPKSSPPPAAVRNTPPPPPAARTMPPTLPRRTSSTGQEEESSSPPIRAPVAGRNSAQPAGLVPDKSSLFSLRKNANKSPVVLPSAFPKRQSNFAPPPVRRPTSSSQQSTSSEPEPEPEPEEQGDWAEALYDYNSGEAGDLVLSAHQRVKIVSRDSDDWWSGEVDGRTGLFPASYVKSL